MKTSELTGAGIDWAVAQIESGAGIDKVEKLWRYSGRVFHPSTDWSQGGPIIEREKITVSSLFTQKNPPIPEYDKNEWGAYIPCGIESVGNSSGPTPLIAAMRCYVASKLGDDVDVPPELT